jgi:hypothetical protein
MKTKFIVVLMLYTFVSVSQNDIDALRYSQTGVGGTARFASMGGAFGALGANTSCLSYNPAGIGIYRKGEINISPGLRFANVGADHNGNVNKQFYPSLIFSSGFGIAGSWQDKKDEKIRHSLGASLNQLQNFNTKTSISTRSSPGKSFMHDLWENAGSSTVGNLDPSYSGMAFNTYLIDTINGQLYSFLDTTKSTLQTKDIFTKGKMNELAIGYTYSFDDKLYLGASLGIPFVNFTHSSTFTEADDRDSMYIKLNGASYSTSYNYPIYYYDGLGGFKSVSYSENYKTSGSGYNLKLGAIYRVNDYLRIGANFQSPTILNLTDTYTFSMVTNFDEGASNTSSYPEGGGQFKYTVITPMRFGGSIAFIYNKLLCVGIDYESVDYGQSQLNSASAGDFAGVNKTIRNKYSRTSNLRTGIEVNVDYVTIRAGYAMYGSPFGEAFTGPFVRHSYSGGLGFRGEHWTFDFGLVKQMYKDDYYMYNPKYVDKTSVSFSGTTFVATIGCKF